MPLKQAIAQVINGRHLSFDESAAAMDAIMDGAASVSYTHLTLPTSDLV